MTKNVNVEVTPNEQYPHWKTVVVDGNAYQLETQENEGTTTILVFKGAEVVPGGRIAAIHKYSDNCTISTYSRLREQPPNSIESVVLQDILAILDTIFKENPIKYYTFQ